MELLSHVKELEQYMIAIRRHLHQYPELSGQEDNTIAFIIEELKKLGVAHEEVPNGGVLGFIQGDPQGKTLLLRADVDALPMTEAATNLKHPRTCISQIDGVSHTCGHDAHVAMLLGAAKFFTLHPELLKGNLLLCFERGEEGTWNIYNLLQHFETKKLKIDGAWGLHMHANLPVGTIGMRPGPVYAGLLGFEVEIRGKGGHGARPWQANNPIDCFAAIMTAMNQVRTREISPLEKLTFSVGGLHSGTKNNIIPETCVFSGTSRFYDAQTAGQKMKEALIRVVEETAAAYHCTAVFNRLNGPTLSTIVNEQCYEIAHKAVGNAIGQDRVITPDAKMSTESFAMYAAYYPAMFGFVGIANPEKGTGAEHHNPYFDVDEDSLIYGACATVSYAIDFLQYDKPITFTPYSGSVAQLKIFTGAQDE